MCQNHAVMSWPLCMYTATCAAVELDLLRDERTRQGREHPRRAPGKTVVGR